MVRPDETAPTLLTAASFPGGFFRHYRVQLLGERGDAWQVHATYSRREDAQACLCELEQTGRRARLVEYSCCPVAI